MDLSKLTHVPPTMAEVAELRRGQLRKPEPRKRTKGRKDRAEAKVKKSVRAACVERDGYCRVSAAWGTFERHDSVPVAEAAECFGPSAWAHMHSRRRSQTRGEAPEARHTTAASLMLCRRHHDQYDGRERPRLHITALTRKGADGPLKFRRAK